MPAIGRALVIGARNASAIGTLVECHTRYLLPVQNSTCKAAVQASTFAGALNAMPAPLRQALTYDQGKKIAEYEKLAKATGMKIFFADPHSLAARHQPTKTPMACYGSIFPTKCRYPS